MQPDEQAVVVAIVTLGVIVIGTVLSTWLAIRQLRRPLVTDLEAQRFVESAMKAAYVLRGYKKHDSLINNV